MRKTFVAAAVATVLSAGAFLTTGASAMTLAAPAGARAAIDATNGVDQVRYVCYRVKRHGVWRRVCEWRPNYGYSYGYGYRPYGYSSYGYGYRPYGYGYGYRRPYGYYSYGYRPYGYYGGYYGYRRPGIGLSFGW